ncbi:MAG: flippase [Candidatus Eisenbacteria bacterium]|uniref:Flippase n=1 Tax=Eiseniibacteriota bacterium TaxID=2212470 RepID=A0A956LZG4_UNCEI|nr:flippase [Candidatus Eisenbacteria bacterium]
MTTFLSRILITLINIPISILIAHRLGTEGQGAYSAMLALTSLWAGSCLLGLDTAHTYMLAGRRFSRSAIISHGIFWSLVLSAVATPLYWLLAPLVRPADQPGLLPSVLMISALAIPLTIGRYFVLAVFLGEGQVDRFNLLNVLSNLVLLAALLLVLVALPGTVVEAAWSYLASLAVFIGLGTWWIFSRESTDRFRWTLDRRLLRQSLSYGLKGHLGNLVVQMTYRQDQILVTRMLGLDQQGLYSVAVMLAEKLSHISASVQLVLFPRVSGLSHEQANALTPRVCRLTLLVVIVAAGALFVLADWVLKLLYPPEFAGALPSLRILLPGVAALSVGKILSGDLSGRNRRVAPTLALTAAFLVNLALNLLWIPRYGIVGAAWASNVAYVLQTCALMGIFWKASGVGPLAVIIPRPSDFARLRRFRDR